MSKVCGQPVFSFRDVGTGEPKEPITGGRGMVTPEVVEGGDGTVSL